MNKNLKFVYITVFITFFTTLPVLSIIFFIHNTKEDRTLKEIVDIQVQDNAIYNSKFSRSNYFQYKLSLVEKIKPEILALGSSRVMQFRKELFNTSFVNAGGAMNHLNEGNEFLKKMINFHKPKYIILGLDFWWFNDNFHQPKEFPQHEILGNANFKKKVFDVFTILKETKLTIDTFLLGLFSLKNEFTNFDNMGIDSLKYSNGFRCDGSYFYSKSILGLQPSHDEHFENTLTRIKKGNSRFEYAKHISKNRVLEFEKIRIFCKENNIKLIVFIPPIAQRTFKEMNVYSSKYKFIEELQLFISNLDIEHYDYHDMAYFKNNDCECIDGFHGGDVVYQRILLDIYNKNSLLKKFINIKLLKQSIKINKGRALSVFNPDYYKSNKEVDFLKLGCEKTPIF